MSEFTGFKQDCLTSSTQQDALWESVTWTSPVRQTTMIQYGCDKRVDYLVNNEKATK